MSRRKKKPLSRSRLTKQGFLLGNALRTLVGLSGLLPGDKVVLHPPEKYLPEDALRKFSYRREAMHRFGNPRTVYEVYAVEADRIVLVIRFNEPIRAVSAPLYVSPQAIRAWLRPKERMEYDTRTETLVTAIRKYLAFCGGGIVIEPADHRGIPSFYYPKHPK